MNQGLIVQLGSPKDIYERPKSEFVANFIGKTNLIHGDVANEVQANSMGKVTTPLGQLTCFFTAKVPATTTKKLAVVVRPENIEIFGPKQTPTGAAENRLTGTVAREVYLGEIAEYQLTMDNGVHIVVRTPPGKQASVNDKVTVHFPPDRTIALIEQS